MSHSHLAIRHLVRELESSPRKSSKAIPPDWLVQLVEDISERFEPFSGIARVGYECIKSESGWDVSMFLGEYEIVGGAGDGRLQPVNFRFRLKDLACHFDSIHDVNWNAFPNSHACFDAMADLSFLSIEGTVNGVLLRLQIHAGPPEGVGPAIRRHVDGRLELV